MIAGCLAVVAWAIPARADGPAADRVRSACEQGVGVACRVEAFQRVRAVTRACAAGEGDACGALETALVESPVPNGAAEAEELAKKACLGGVGEGCLALIQVQEGPALSDPTPFNVMVSIREDGLAVAESTGRPPTDIACHSGGRCTGPDDYDIETLDLALASYLRRFPHERKVIVSIDSAVPVESFVHVSRAVGRRLPVLVPAGGSK